MSAMDSAWAFALLGMFLANALYCLYLFNKNKTWKDYRKPGTRHYFVLGVIMGIIWMASVAIFGRGSALMGDLGKSAGWGMWMGLTVLVSNFWGFASGEWKGVKGTPLKLMVTGALVMVVAIGFIGYSATL
jgi:L-rhamnose-H+ transport protein